MKSFLARRLIDGFALTLMAASLYWILCVLSYHAGDPSLNTIAGDAANPTNKGGFIGSYLADLMVQTLGYASVLLGFAPLVWGYRLLRRRPATPALAVRVGCALTGVVLICLGLARIPVSQPDQILVWGGALGGVGLNAVSAPLATLIGGWSLSVVAALAALLGIVVYCVSLGFSRAAWAAFGRKILAVAARAMMGVVAAAHGAMQWLHRYDRLGGQGDQDLFADKPRTKTAPKAPIIDIAPAQRAEHAADNTSAMSSPVAAPAASTSPRKDAEIIVPKKAAQEAAPARQKSLSFTDFGDWEFPPIDIMQQPKEQDVALELDEKALQRNADLLQQVLIDFNVEGEIVKIRPGPVVTLYEFEPAAGVKSSRVIGLADDIARSMSAVSVRAAVVPGRNVIGIEIPNQKRQIVYIRSLLETREYDKTTAKLPLILGKDIGGEPVVADLAKMPHLLVAGTTGSGKSVGINTMILSLVYRLPPEKCRMIMIDPKMLELSVYDDIPHLLSPVVTDPGRAVVALKWAVQEMENRYRSMSKFGVRNIDGYNQRINEALAKGEVLTRKVQTGFDPESGKPVFEEEAIELRELPYIVVVVDEFADLMLVAGKDVENAIQRLAQMARAAGIHLIMATQRPSVDVITGVIKANFPTRISFQVTSKFDSRTILGDSGAEQLLGMGDMLYMASGGKIQRVHGPFVADEEVEHVVRHLKAQGEPSYLDDVTEGEDGGMMGLFGGDGESGGSGVDDLYDQAVALVAREGKASTSFIQRHLQIGYNRAARIIEEMEKQGVVGQANHVGKREVLITDHSRGAA